MKTIFLLPASVVSKLALSFSQREKGAQGISGLAAFVHKEHWRRMMLALFQSWRFAPFVKHS